MRSRWGTPTSRAPRGRVRGTGEMEATGGYGRTRQREHGTIGSCERPSRGGRAAIPAVTRARGDREAAGRVDGRDLLARALLRLDLPVRLPRALLEHPGVRGRHHRSLEPGVVDAVRRERLPRRRRSPCRGVLSRLVGAWVPARARDGRGRHPSAGRARALRRARRARAGTRASSALEVGGARRGRLPLLRQLLRAAERAATCAAWRRLGCCGRSRPPRTTAVGRASRRSAVAWLVVAGGYPGQTASFALVGLAYVVVELRSRRGWPWRTMLVPLVLAAVACAGVTLALTLPYIEASSREELIRLFQPTVSVRATWAIHPLDALGLYLNNFAWDKDGTIAAWAVAIPALIGVACVRRRELGRQASLAIVGGVALVLGMRPAVRPIGKLMAVVRPSSRPASPRPTTRRSSRSRCSCSAPKGGAGGRATRRPPLECARDRDPPRRGWRRRVAPSTHTKFHRCAGARDRRSPRCA